MRIVTLAKLAKLSLRPEAVFLAAIWALALIMAWVPESAAQKWRVTEDDAWCREGDGEATHCEVREATLRADGKVIRVDGRGNGGIGIESWNRDEIRIRAKVRVWGKRARDAREMAGEIEIRTGREIRAEGPRTGKREGWAVSYEIMVPRRSDLELQTTNGGISISDVHGDIEFKAVNGGIHLHDLGGRVHGRTTNGGLSIELGGPTWDGEGLEVKTTNGGITLALPERYSAELETGTVNGQVHVEFPIEVQGSIGKRVRTTLGNGGPPIRLITTNGGVRIHRD